MRHDTVNGTNQWPVYTTSDPQNFVFDVNATQFSYQETDDFRSDAIAYWMELFAGEYPK